MTPEVAAILGMDGVATGAIYVLIALGIVLIFAVTRVIFVPFGDIAAFTALTLGALETKRLPGTVALVAALAGFATLIELAALLRSRAFARIPRACAMYLLLPLTPAAIVFITSGTLLPTPARLALAVALILPVAPLLDRVVFRPIADAPVLLLLIVALALHFALAGLGLMFFGPEGVRTRSLIDDVFVVGGVPVPAQTLLIIAAAAAFSLLLYLFFEFTLTGKALRATALNRTGARLMGIRPERTAAVAYLLGCGLAAVSGILISPVNTIFYDSGLLIGLKAFIGAIIGGLVSFPVTAAGALSVGLLESFAAFQSSAFKEVIVFSVLIPVLLWRSYTWAQGGAHAEETSDE
jgi:branched-chain amino acid transport system permease protein